jgi:hypothetical protein
MWPLLVAFGPLVLASLPALRRPRSVGEQILGLWLLAVAVSYLIFPGSRDAAFEGVSLPLAILAVKGWQRRKFPASLAWVVILLAIVPGAFYSAHTFRDIFRSHDYAFALSRGEQRLVDALRDVRSNVLATSYLARALPGLTGLLNGQVSAGSDQFFGGRETPQAAERLINRGRISLVAVDCLRGRAELSTVLHPLGFTEQRYGCARLYLRGG